MNTNPQNIKAIDAAGKGKLFSAHIPNLSKEGALLLDQWLDDNQLWGTITENQYSQD